MYDDVCSTILSINLEMFDVTCTWETAVRIRRQAMSLVHLEEIRSTQGEGEGEGALNVYVFPVWIHKWNLEEGRD